MKTKFKEYFKRFKELQGTPGYLARGVAIGVFVGIAPLMPLKTVIIVALTLAFSGSTVAGILLCTIICNPVTYLPLYYFAWRVGDYLLPGRASWQHLDDCLNEMDKADGIREALIIAAQAGLDTALVVLAGGTILALPLGMASYPLAYNLFVRLAKERHKKHLMNNE